MKIVKPLRLSTLTRPYRWHGQDHLGVAVLAMSTLSDAPRLVLEQELWKSTAGEIGTGAVLDLGVPKRQPEVLVSGHAYTHHQPDKTCCAVQMQVGQLHKSLTVFGERYWLDGRPTAPRPFDRMPLDWAHAYGGPGVPANPLGMGAVDEEIQGVRRRRLPHIERPGARPASPTSAVAPAGLGAIPPDWAPRMSLLGTQYGQAWLENDFPGFARDIDWRYFNAAPADQRWEDRETLPAGAAYALWNMHPDVPVQRGHLPRWHARAFVRVRGEGAGLHELGLRLTTAWFFPHLERVVMIWHGTRPIREDDAADVETLVAAIERDEDAPRGIDHYEAVVARRADPERGAIHALRDSELAPRSVLNDWGDLLPDVLDEPLPRNLRAGMQRDHARRSDALRAQGLDPQKYLPALTPVPALPDIDDLPDFLAQQEPQVQEALAMRDAMLGQLQERPAPLAPSSGAGSEGKPDEGRDDEDPDDADDAQALPAAAEDDIDALRRTAQLHSAHLAEPARPAPSFRSAKWRRRLAAAQPAARDFSRQNLVGVDLSGMDLRGARFVGALLEGAVLQGAQLDGCDFSQAVLVRADLRQASMKGALLQGANLGGARCIGTDLEGAQLIETLCPATVFEDCRLVGARFEQVQWNEARLLRCDASRSQWLQVACMQQAFDASRFDDASFTQVAWIECRLPDASFVGAQLSRSGFVTCDCTGADYSHARLEGCSFAHGSTLLRARFRSAHLKESGFRTTPMQDADLGEARIENCDLSECDLSHAVMDRISGADSLFIRTVLAGTSLREAVLIDANLSKSDLRGADLTRANLFRADVSQTLVDALTLLDGAYTQHAKRWPTRTSGVPAA